MKKLTEEQLQSIENYKQSVNELLTSFGWQKVDENHWASSEDTFYVSSGERVCARTAVEALLGSLYGIEALKNYDM